MNNFGWQDGYGIFSLSASKVFVVEKYICTQSIDHEKVTFKEELRGLYKEYGIDYDERYLWD